MLNINRYHIVLGLFLQYLSFAVLAQPTLSVNFTPNTIGPGANSRLLYTITNGSGSPVTGISFSNILPTVPGDVDISAVANASTNCDLGLTGSISAPNGGGTVSLSDARLGANQSCFVEVNVTASTPGVHTNPAVTLTSSAGSNMSLPRDLTVVTTLPGFSKSFAPSTVTFGAASTLTITIDNTLNGSVIGNLDFNDVLPTGMSVADPANAFTNCISASAPNTTLTAVPGTNQISLDANGSTFFPGFEVLSAGAICTVTVDVITNTTGSLTNQTTDLLADFTSSGFAVNSLNVTPSQLILTKDFTDDPIPPGNDVTLLFTIFNANRNFSASNVSFTDDLSATLAGLTFSSIISNDCSGSSVTGLGGTSISFSNGTLAPEGSCTIEVSLAVPVAAAAGSYLNTTSNISGVIDGDLITDNPATAELFVEPTPILIKEFLQVGTLTPDPVVNPGDDVVLRFTIVNTSTTSMATDIAFDDELTNGGPGTGFLPFPISVSTPVLPSNDLCGMGSNLAFFFPDTERQGLRFTAGTLDQAPGAGSTCTFDVTLTVPNDFAAGTYTNTTSGIMATVDGATRMGDSASDTLTVIAAPSLNKAFTDDPVAPGGTVTLEFTLEHNFNSPTDATGITFTDDLNTVLAGLTANVPPLPDPPCGPSSSLTTSAGDTLLTFAGGTLAPGENCSFSVTLDVPAGAAAGTYTNTTSVVGATVSGSSTTSLAASSDLNVAGLEFSKEFLTNPVVPGETTTLRFTIDNVHPTDDATITFFSDNLQLNLTGLAATGPASIDTCGGTLSGTTFLTYIGGNVTAGNSCVIEVPVLVPLAAADGNYPNITSSLSATQGGAIVIPPATDNLVVDSNLLQLTKSFTSDPVAAGGPVTLEFVLTNLDASNAASDIDFTDDLAAALAGLTFDALSFNDCGATVTGLTTSLITVDGAALAAGGTCTIRVDLTVPSGAAAGLYTNTTSTVTGMISGFNVNGAAASDVLEVVELLTFDKSFDGPATATGTAILTFTITNPGTSVATGIAFSDDLDAVITGLIATNLPTAPCGVGSSISGTSLLTFTGGELAALGGMCSFDVEVTVPVTATAGTFPNTTSDLFASGLTVADPATADLIIEPAPSFAKAFTPDAIGQGLTSTLTFSIENTASSIAAANLNFIDNLPAGMVITTPTVTNNTCGGTLTAVAGSAVISLTGGSVGSGASCIIQVDVQGNNTGDLVNLTGDLTSSAGNSGTATDTLTVNPQPLFSKNFSPDPIIVGGVTTLTFTIDNSLSTVTTTALDFIDNLPTNLVIATPANTTNTCGGTLTATNGANAIDFTGGTVAAASACTIAIDITANASGTFMNVSSDLTSSLGNSGTATDDLLVNPAPLFNKAFTPDVIANGATTTLIFTIDNSASTVNATALNFNDTLPMGLTVAATPNASTTCSAGTLTAAPASNSIIYSGGTVNAADTCTISVDVTASQTGSLINQTGDLTSSSGNSGIAMDTLIVTTLPTFSKAFGTNPNIINVPTILTFSVNNSLGQVDISGLTFSDNLPAGMEVAPIPNASATCSGGIITAVAGSNSISYTGGTVTTASVCNVSVDVIATTSGSLVNTSSILSTDLGDSNSANATLNIDSAPGFSKAFIPDAIAPNGTSQLVFTVDNSLSTIMATALDFVDNLPANLNIATPANASTTCSGGTLTAIDGGNSITYTNGSLAGSSMCTVTVDVTSSVLGSLTNTSGDLTSSHGNSGPAMATLLVTNAPTITKTFTTNPQLINDVNTLTFTIDNSLNTIDVTDLAFNDPLPAGMLVNTPANASTTCTGGLLSAVDGSNIIDYSGGTVTAASSCTITVDIVPSVFGTLTNTTSTLATSLGNSNSATADLTIDPAPLFSKAFMPNAIPPNGISQLQLNIDNSGSTIDVSNLDFADVLPTGLVIATPTNITNTCTGGILSAVQGLDTITYSGGSTPAGSNCTISLDVTAALANTYTNLTGNLTSSHGNSGTATADLLVTNAPTLAKVFTINPHVINQPNPLVFTIDNSMNSIDVGNLTFNDPLPAGLEVANPANASTTCTGGTLTAVAGSSIITYTNGTVNASSSCTVTVDTVATVTGQFTNTTSALSTSLGASNQAIADLTISSAPIFSKAFMPDLIVEGGVSQLVFTIDNSANNLAASNLDFTDNLPAGLSITTSPIPTINCNIGELGGVFSGLPGSSVISFSNGSMEPLSICTITVDVTALSSGTYENITGDLTSNFGNSGTATATLTVQPGISATKSFVSNTVFAGQTIVLDFTISNNADIPASGITFSDDLNAFVPGSAATDLPQNDVCGTGSSLTGSSIVTLSDGSLAPNSSCQFSVTVVIPENTIQGDYINVTSPVDADFNGTTVNGSASSSASTSLIINGAIRMIPVNSWLTLSILSLMLLIFAYRSFIVNKQ